MSWLFLFHFCEMNLVCFNGATFPADDSLFNAQNRCFRYGDGIFETIKIFQGNILLQAYHFERLFLGLNLLKINAEAISEEKLQHEIVELCRLNDCVSLARVRLAFYRDENNSASYIIEATKISHNANQLNEVGWITDLYPHARKGQDVFANLKTANYLPYVMADVYARDKALDECLLLNSENNICDGSKTNVFLIIKNEAFTPSLNQGCVSGTMRRHIIDELKRGLIPVHQREINERLLMEADEVFLTNAIQGIRWVQKFRDKTYSNVFVKKFYQKVFASFYQP